jgi:sarcosine oxidase, subunit beta
MDADIIVLGAGVIGASVAWHLAQRGAGDILVVDRAADLGAGSTAKATGGFRAQFDNETEVRLSLLSRRKLLAFENETGADPGYRQHGYLFLACTTEEVEAMRAAQAVQHACGMTDSRMLTAAEARSLNPAIEDESVIAAAWCPTDGFIRPMDILRGYAAAATRAGVRFAFGREHHGFRVQGDRAVAAKTSAGELRARLFINAMGAWSGAPVVPLRRNVAATVATDLVPESMPMTIWAGDWFHLRKRDGRVLLLWPDDPCVDDWLDRVRAMARARVPSLGNLAIDECWSGFYEMTPDGHAVVGRSPDHQNVILATGCSGHGVMHAPAIGQLIAELVVDGKTSIDIEALSPARF